MAKSKFKNPLVIIFVLAIIAIAAWFFLSNTVNKKAEEQLQQYLVDNNLEGKLKWESLDASPTGTATLKNVSFLDDQGDVLMTAEEFLLKRYKEDETILETEVEIKRLVEVKQLGLQEALNDLYELIDTPSPNYIDLKWEVSLDNNKQKSYMRSVALLPELIEIESEITGDSPAKIRELSALTASSYNPENANQQELMELYAALGEVQIKSLTVGLQDKGAIEKLRYEFFTVNGLADPETQEAQLEEEVANATARCINEPDLDVLVKNTEAACNKLMSFLEGSDDDIKFILSIDKPQSINDIMMMAFMGLDAVSFAKEYGLEVEVK